MLEKEKKFLKVCAKFATQWQQTEQVQNFKEFSEKLHNLLKDLTTRKSNIWKPL